MKATHFCSLKVYQNTWNWLKEYRYLQKSKALKSAKSISSLASEIQGIWTWITVGEPTGLHLVSAWVKQWLKLEHTLFQQGIEHLLTWVICCPFLVCCALCSLNFKTSLNFSSTQNKGNSVRQGCLADDLWGVKLWPLGSHAFSLIALTATDTEVSRLLSPPAAASCTQLREQVYAVCSVGSWGGVSGCVGIWCSGDGGNCAVLEVSLQQEWWFPCVWSLGASVFLSWCILQGV